MVASIEMSQLCMWQGQLGLGGYAHRGFVGVRWVGMWQGMLR